MKKALQFTPIKLTDIPRINHDKMHALMQGIRAFHESDADAAEIPASDYKTPASLVNALTTAARREGLGKAVRVMQRRGRVFLVRVAALRKL